MAVIFLIRGKSTPMSALLNTGKNYKYKDGKAIREEQRTN